MSSLSSKDFFDNVDSTNLPASSAGKSQPWSAFHKADESLVNAKSIVVDVPNSEESGKTDQNLCHRS